MIESFKLPTITPETLTGSICSFTDEYGGLPLKSCTSLISGYQEGSGTPSPSNVRPLHAFSSASLYVSAKNIIDINDAHITSQTFSSNIFLKAGTYTLSANYNNVSNINGYLRLNTRYEPITQLVSLTLTANDSGRSSASFTLENDSICRLAFQGESIGYDFYVSNIMLEVGGSETSFEPYNGNTYTFTFGQSIYQGEIDWERGVVVGTMAMVDLGDLTWAKDDSTVQGKIFFRAQLTNAKNAFRGICSVYPFMGSYSNIVDKSCGYIYNTRIAVMDSLYESGDATAFKTAMDGVMLAYELATPIMIPLGGINLLTQEGQNNIFCDTGNTEVKRLKVN